MYSRPGQETMEAEEMTLWIWLQVATFAVTPGSAMGVAKARGSTAAKRETADSIVGSGMREVGLSVDEALRLENKTAPSTPSLFIPAGHH